jgi:hypothetical protein
VTRSVRLVVLLLPMAVVLFVGVLLVAAAGKLTNAVPCAQPDNRLVDGTMVVVCVAAFAIGRFLVDKRDQSADKLTTSRRAHATGAHALLSTDPKGARRGALVVHLALAVLFACGVGALAYETVGVWSDNPWGFQPITHYVRCAKGTNWPLTLLVGATLSFFVGHWLWFPMKRSDR